jgi:hypothetical protein
VLCHFSTNSDFSPKTVMLWTKCAWLTQCLTLSSCEQLFSQSVDTRNPGYLKVPFDVQLGRRLTGKISSLLHYRLDEIKD